MQSAGDFVLKWAGDVTGLVRSVHEATSAVDRHTASIRQHMVDATSVANHYVKSITGAFGSVAGMVGLPAGLGLGLYAVHENLQKIVAVGRDANTLGLPVEEYSRFSQAARMLGMEVEDVRDSLIDLRESAGEALAEPDSGKAKAFKAMGVSVKDANSKVKDSIKLMLDLSEKAAAMPRDKAIFYLKQMGITDNKMIATMLMGRQKLEEMMKKTHPVTLEDVAASERATIAISSMQIAAEALGNRLSVIAAPAVELLADMMMSLVDGLQLATDFVMQHQSFLVSLAVVIGTLLLPATLSWAAATVVALAPVIAIGAAIALVALFIDDLYNYFTGGESVIGEWAAQFPWLKSVLDGAAAAGKWLKDRLSELMTIFDETPKFGWVATLKEWLTGLLHPIESVKASFDLLKKGLGSLWDKLTGGGEITIENKTSSGNTPGGRDMMIPGDNPALAAPVPLTPGQLRAQQQGDISNSKQVSQRIESNVVIYGAQDPAAVGAEVGHAQAKVFRDAAHAHDTGDSH